MMFFVGRVWRKLKSLLKHDEAADDTLHKRTRREQIEWRARCRKWNEQPGISVSPDAFVAPTAQLQLRPDGVWQGGEIRIEARAIISDGVILAPYGGHIHIGEAAFIGPYSVVGGHGGTTIGARTLIAAHSVLIPANHIFAKRDVPIAWQGETKRGISLDEDVWLGAGVRVLDGVSIGRGCVVGAGAVVTKSLAPYSVAVGVPARVVRQRDE